MASQKFRPAFTKQELAYLLDLCSHDDRESTSSMASTIAARLRIFGLKADLGIVSPAFVSIEKQSIDDRLGLGDSPMARRATAYKKYCENPSYCTAAELKMALTYKYENDLMTPEEEAEYESQ